MNPRITVTIEGDDWDAHEALKALGQVGSSVIETDTPRGIVSGAKKIGTWILEFTGGSAKAADALLEQATSQLAGASVKVQIGDRIVVVDGINRSQVLEVMKQAEQLATDARSL